MSYELSQVLAAPRNLWRGLASWLHERMPKGLYARALLIVILPVILLQSAVAYFFMERHLQAVTARLSAAVARDVAAVVDLYQTFPEQDQRQILQRIAAFDLNIDLQILPKGPLPAETNKPFFSLLDHALTRELSRRVRRPFWIDTVGHSNLVEIRVGLEDANLQIFATRTQAYASNSHIFFIWMAVGLDHHPCNRHILPAQPDPAHRTPGGRCGRIRQGPRG